MVTSMVARDTVRAATPYINLSIWSILQTKRIEFYGDGFHLLKHFVSLTWSHSTSHHLPTLEIALFFYSSLSLRFMLSFMAISVDFIIFLLFSLDFPLLSVSCLSPSGSTWHSFAWSQFDISHTSKIAVCAVSVVLFLRVSVGNEEKSITERAKLVQSSCVSLNLQHSALLI